MKTSAVKQLVVIILVSICILCFAGCKGNVINQNAPGTEGYENEHPGVDRLSDADGQPFKNEHSAADGTKKDKEDIQPYETAENQEQSQAFEAPSHEKSAVSAGLKINIKPAPQIKLDLRPYKGGFFSINLPAGWKMEPVGEYESFGFRAYDPDNPARQLFFYGNMKYFLKSNAGKQAWTNYLAFGGYSSAQVYADAPVLSPATTEQFFYTFNTYTSYASKYGVVHNFPIFDELEIVESTQRNSPIAVNCIDDSIVRALFTQDNVPCEGLFAAGVADAMISYMYNVDAGYYVVYFITGISAPADEFYLIQDTLSKSLSSFQFDEDYIRQGVQRIDEGTKLALEIGKMLSQTSEANNQAWHNRQRPIDTLSQKRSDERLGYDRLYDTETGEIYRAELGFYDDYDLHRNEYTNPNLQLVPDDDYNLYEKGISWYIYK